MDSIFFQQSLKKQSVTWSGRAGDREDVAGHEEMRSRSLITETDTQRLFAIPSLPEEKWKCASQTDYRKTNNDHKKNNKQLKRIYYQLYILKLYVIKMKISNIFLI